MAGKYQRYPEYKDSGVDWLGEVPTHWKVTTLKYEGLLTPPKSELTASQLCKDATFVPMEKLKTGKLDTSETKAVSEVVNGYTYFRENDVLLAKVTPCFENKNMAVARNLKNELGFGSSEIYVFRPTNLITSVFWFYRFQESEFMALATGAMTGAGGLKRVPSDFIESFKVAVPDIEERSNIANFLDHETAKIDTLIEKQQQLIKLLKEKRQAVISHAVTKGLNPDAPLKDSGVEWLGEVPEHWVISKFGYISQVVRGGSPRPAGDPTLFDGDFSPWVTVAEITKDDEIFLTKTESFLTKKGSEQCRVFSSGTLILSNSGATLGVPAILKIDANANDGVVGFENLKVNSEFAYFYLSSLTNDLRERIKQGSGQPNLNTDIVKNINVPVPPKEEVEAIVNHIHKLRNKYSKLIIKSESAILLMKERRTALISAAVTGKIDVRNWQPTNNKNTEEGEVTA